MTEVPINVENPCKLLHEFKKNGKYVLDNEKIGKYFIVGRSNKPGYWKCKCDCGNKLLIYGYNLIHKNRDHCGCSKIKKQKNLQKIEKTCQRCKNLFTPYRNSSRFKFCSWKCYRNLDFLYSCKTCKKKLYNVSNINKNNFCSIECKIKDLIKTDKNGCWEYKKKRSRHNSITFKFLKKKYHLCHTAYELYIKKMDSNTYLCRSCSNYKCINPNHYKEIAKDIFYKDIRKKYVVKKINENIVIKIIEFYELGLTSKEIVEHYTTDMRNKIF